MNNFYFAPTFVFLGLVFSWAVSAQSSLYSKGYFGEHDYPLYSGPGDSDFVYDWNQVQFISKDDQRYQSYFWNVTASPLSDLQIFFASDFKTGGLCSHDYLESKYDYIQYGYRLLSLSLLLEDLDALKQLSLKTKAGECAMDLDKLLASCHPQSQDMISFLAQLKGQKIFNETILLQGHSFEKEQSTLISNLKKSKQTSVAEKRLLLLSSAPKDWKEVKERFKQSCQEDQEEFKQICSEQDHFYGHSFNSAMTYWLGRSHFVNTFNQTGLAQGCLRRFTSVMSLREQKETILLKMLPQLSAELKEKFQDRYPQGRAFIFGSLKEFEEKGLGNVFEAPKPIVVSKQPVLVGPEVIVVESKPTVAINTPPIISKNPVAMKEVTVISKSAFLQASEARREQNVARIDVDMLKFKYDYVFPLAELELLRVTLKDYTSRVALEEMKRFDKLGTQQTPVPLSFIKFMLDTKDYQALYNLINVLGDRFWVANNLDRAYKTVPEWIEFKNNESSTDSWEIDILDSQMAN